MQRKLQSRTSGSRPGTPPRHRRWMASVAALLLLAVEPALAQVVFNIAFDPSANVLTATEKNNITSHLQEAGRRWVNKLAVSGPRSIEVIVAVSNIPTASGASLVTGYVGTVNGRDTFEQGVAAELRTGVDPNGADNDAIITFGLTYLRTELWFDPNPQTRTATVPVDKTDAMSTVLHEFGHILAYNGFADLNTGQPPATYWSTWDRWMIPGQPTLFSGPFSVAAWGSLPDLTIGNLMHWGNAAQAASGSGVEICPDDITRWQDGAPIPRRCFAPASANAPPSDIANGAQSIAAGGSLTDQLMNGVVFYRGSRYDISSLDLGALRDVGLTLDRIFVAGFDSP